MILSYIYKQLDSALVICDGTADLSPEYFHKSLLSLKTISAVKKLPQRQSCFHEICELESVCFIINKSECCEAYLMLI